MDVKLNIINIFIKGCAEKEEQENGEDVKTVGVEWSQDYRFQLQRWHEILLVVWVDAIVERMQQQFTPDAFYNQWFKRWMCNLFYFLVEFIYALKLFWM